MANKRFLIGILAIMLVFGGCPESEDVKDGGKDAPKTVKYESTDTAGKTYIFIITVSGSGVAEGDTYVITIKEAGQPDKIITGVVSEKGTDGTLTLKQNNSEQPLSVTVGNGQMTAINGPIAVEGGEPITAPGPLTPIVNNNNNNNNGSGEEINTGGNWLQRKIISYKVSNGEASVSGEENINWLIYRQTSSMDYEQKYTSSGYSTTDSGTIRNFNNSYHTSLRYISNTNYEMTSSSTYSYTYPDNTTYTSTSQQQQIQNGLTASANRTYEQTYSDGRFLKQNQTETREFDAATYLLLRYTMSVTNNSNMQGVPQDQNQTGNFTINLLSDTGGIKTYKHYDTSKDAGTYGEYKFQNGRQVEGSEYENGVLKRTSKTTYDNGHRVMEEYKNYNSDGGLSSSGKTTYDDNGREVETYTNDKLSSRTTYNSDSTITQNYYLNSTETETKVTIKDGLILTTKKLEYVSSSNASSYNETVTVLSDTGSEVVVRKQRLTKDPIKSNNYVLTQQTDTTYRK